MRTGQQFFVVFSQVLQQPKALLSLYCSTFGCWETPEGQSDSFASISLTRQCTPLKGHSSSSAHVCPQVQDPNYIAYGAAGVAAVGLIYYFTSSGSGKKAEHKGLRQVPMPDAPTAFGASISFMLEHFPSAYASDLLLSLRYQATIIASSFMGVVHAGCPGLLRQTWHWHWHCPSAELFLLLMQCGLCMVELLELGMTADTVYHD